jgi:hypothetical protein
MTLPPYADNALGRELIAAIVAERPEQVTIRHKLPSVYGGYPDGTTTSFIGKAASRLRRLRKEWIEREFDLLSRQFAATHYWPADEVEAILRVEEADALIARVIAEADARKEAA